MSVFELETGNAISAFDAGFNPETPPETGTADTFDAGGPNRFTIWIPSEQVSVNMGLSVVGTVSGMPLVEDRPATGSGPPTQIDRGFVVQTDNHVHFHAFGIPTTNGTPNLALNAEPQFIPDERTVLRLGTPATVPKATGDYGTKELNPLGIPISIGSGFPHPYNLWNGFAMLTEGGAYQESRANHLIVSKDADLRLAGLRTVLIGSPGNVHIMADGSNIADVVGNDGGGDWNLNAPGKWIGYHKTEHPIDAAIALFAAFLGVGILSEEVFTLNFAREPTEGVVGWESAAATDWIGMGFKLAAAGLGIYAATTALSEDDSTGNVAMYASSSIQASGAFSTSIHGGVVTSVSSTVAMLISGNVVTSLSSMALVSISGLLTSASGLLSASLTSQLGSVKMVGRTKAEISSSGKIFVTGKENVQLNSTDGNVFFHGSKGFYLGTGAGPATPAGLFGAVTYGQGPVPGWGIVGHPSEGLKIGKMKDAKKLKDPQPDDTTQIIMDDQGVRILSNGSEFAFGGEGASMSCQRIQLG